MKKSVLLILFLSMFSFAQAQSSATTDYWFEGFIYKNNNEGHPFLTVVLTEIGNDKPKAVSMSSDIGYVDFKGVPIDIYKDHILSVYMGNILLGQYVRDGFKKKPKFTGNLNVHMNILNCSNEFKKVSYTPTDDENSMYIGEFLIKKGFDIEDISIFPINSQAPFKLFLNGHHVDYNKISVLLKQISMKMVQNINIYEYINPNPYYSGAISIQLTEGPIATFPVELPLRSLREK